MIKTINFFLFGMLFTGHFASAQSLDKYCIGKVDYGDWKSVAGYLEFSLDCNSGKHYSFETWDCFKESCRVAFKKTNSQALGLQVIENPALSRNEGLLFYVAESLAEVPASSYGIFYRIAMSSGNNRPVKEAMSSSLDGNFAKYGQKEIQGEQDYTRLDDLEKLVGFTNTIAKIRIPDPAFSYLREVFIVQKP